MSRLKEAVLMIFCFFDAQALAHFRWNPVQNTTEKYEACFFLRHGWFSRTALNYNPEDLIRGLQEVIPSFPSDDYDDFSEEEILNILHECQEVFKPEPMRKLTENLSGVSSEVFGETRGFPIDLLRVQAVCPDVLRNLVDYGRTGEMETPFRVILICLDYFATYVIKHLLY